jgi:hypothetical protein
MDTLILIFSVVLFRFFLYAVKSYTQGNGKNVLLAIMILTIFICALPLILIKKGVLEDGDINVLIAGITLFYFPFIVGRMSK